MLLSGVVLKPGPKYSLPTRLLVQARSGPTSRTTGTLSDQRATMRAELEAMAARIELLLLAAIMRAPVGSLPQNSGDPIFALIQAHWQANIARSRCRVDELARTMFATEPTTVAGAAALMTYVTELIERSDGRPADWDWSLPLHRTLMRALVKIYERTAPPPDHPNAT